MHATQEVVTVIRDSNGKVEKIFIKEGSQLVLKNVKPAKETDLIEVINGDNLTK